MFENLLRTPPLPSNYGVDNRTPANLDVLLTEINVIAFFLLVLTLLLLPSFNWNGKDNFISSGKRVLFWTFFGWVLYSFTNHGIFGPRWAVAHIDTRTPYIPYSSTEVRASVGLEVGLMGFNVTVDVLDGLPDPKNAYFNEHFSWRWQQGIFGFGRLSGRVSQDFRAAQVRGVPIPAQYVAEYFTLDGEYIRWGRNFRTAGYYSFLLLRSATVILLLVVVIFLVKNYEVGGMLCAFIGLLGLIACTVFGLLIGTVGGANKNPLMIPFRDGVLSPRLGESWYLTLFTSILCILFGVSIRLRPWIEADSEGKKPSRFTLERKQKQRSDVTSSLDMSMTSDSFTMYESQQQIPPVKDVDSTTFTKSPDSSTYPVSNGTHISNSSMNDNRYQRSSHNGPIPLSSMSMSASTISNSYPQPLSTSDQSYQLYTQSATSPTSLTSPDSLIFTNTYDHSHQSSDVYSQSYIDTSTQWNQIQTPQYPQYQPPAPTTQTPTSSQQFNMQEQAAAQTNQPPNQSSSEDIYQLSPEAQANYAMMMQQQGYYPSMNGGEDVVAQGGAQPMMNNPSNMSGGGYYFNGSGNAQQGQYSM